MKLISIQLCNFRQFYGKTPVISLASGKKNTTVIHGNNGGGKTTLLNAFTWVLYEQFTSAFSSPELLVNKRAIVEANGEKAIECWVDLRFERDNKQYQLKRRCYGSQDARGGFQCSESQAFMLLAGDDGSWYSPTQPVEEIIGNILPKSLHQYFFFDGEQIDRIFRYGNKHKLAEDTKELIGVKVLDRAIDHLKKARKTLEEELQNIGNVEITLILNNKTKLELEKEHLNERQEEIVRELAYQEEIKKTISSRMLNLSGADELQQLKLQLQKEEQLVRKNLLAAKNKLKFLISRRSHTVFLTEAIEQFQATVNSLREKKQLPNGIKQQFIRQLLQNEICLCGTQLNEGNEYYLKVREWLDRTQIAEREESALRLESQTQKILAEMTYFWQEIDREQSNIHSYRSEISELETRLDDLKNKLRKYPDEDIQALQKRLDNIETTIKDLTLEKGAIRQQIENFNKQIDELAKEIVKGKIKEDKQAIATLRIEAAAEAISRLIEVKSRLQTQFRLSLENTVSEIFNSISFTPYIPQLSQDYELSLVENISGNQVSVAASTGENQILSLSFIAAIVQRVREWTQKSNFMAIDSSTFPIVMDSPFGSLDENYRRQVAKFLPLIANQLIVLATKTQWRGEVATEIDDYIGKEYVLVYNSPKTDCDEDEIELRGITYPLVKHSRDRFEYTEVLQVQTE
jgi:DNA sulfur modification protein DndD